MNNENENEQIKTVPNVPTSYRMQPDTKEKLQQQLKDSGLSTEQFFNRVVLLMELENVKENSFLSKDTTVIKSNLDAILNAFISVADSSNNLINNKDAELKELKEKYKDILSDKEDRIASLKQEVHDAYSKLGVLESENTECKNELGSVKAEYKSQLSSAKFEYDKQIQQLKNNLADKDSLIAEYKQRNDDLTGTATEYKQCKEEVEQYKKLLADAQSRELDLGNKLKEQEFTINALNEDIEKLNKENQKEIGNLKKESELITRSAITELKEQLNDKFNQEQLKHNKEIEELNNKLSQEQQRHSKEIEEYQAKYKALLEKLESATNTKKDIKKDNK